MTKELRSNIRVLAVSHADEGAVYIFGEGIYEGDFIPKEAVGVMADICRKANRENPRIRLDSGKIVYGCECWWGGIEDAKKKTGITDGKKVIELDIDEERKKFCSVSEVEGREDD